MSRRTRAFTLIELLIVITIVGILIAVLLPALSKAQRSAKIAACGVNQHQIHVALTAYAVDHKNRVPRGPDVPIVFLPTYNWSDIGSKVIWLPYFGGVLGIPTPGATNALGVLLEDHHLANPKAFYCPGDTRLAAADNLAKLTTHDPAALAEGSYMYRQLDQTSSQGRFDDLGRNDAGVRATSLVFDQVIEGFNGENSDNHDQRAANALFIDGRVALMADCGDALVFRASDGVDPTPPTSFVNLQTRMNQVLVNLDYSREGDIASAPQLP